MRAAYNNLKCNARRRGKDFDLSFEEFSKFALMCDYLKGKGRKSTSYSIDRIDNEKGYTLDNIQVTTLGENSRKGTMTLDAFYDHYERKVVAWVRKTNPNIKRPEDENLPF